MKTAIKLIKFFIFAVILFAFAVPCLAQNDFAGDKYISRYELSVSLARLEKYIENELAAFSEKSIDLKIESLENQLSAVELTKNRILEQERKEKERLERNARERRLQRIRKERDEKEKLEQERLEKERLEKEKLEKNKAEQKELEREQERLARSKIKRRRPSTKFFENIGNAIGGAGKGIGGALGAAGKGIGGAIGGAGQGIGGFFGATAEGIGSAIGNVGNALGNIRIQLPQRAPEKEKVFEQEKIRKEIPAPLIKPQPQTLEESIDLLVNIIRGEAPLSDLGKALPQIATGMLVLSLKMGLFVFVLFVILALFKEWEKIARKK